MKPIIKWAGGKASLIPQMGNILEVLQTNKVTNYIEPFVGGGALFFHLREFYEFESVTLNDKNPLLINLYRVVRDNLSEFKQQLKLIDFVYNDMKENERKEFYNETRDLFNKKSKNLENNNVELAVYFMFLNKTCFNGLFRVNSKMEFNVPHGKYTNPKIYDEDNLDKASKFLQGVNLICLDYGFSINPSSTYDKQTFIYYDPPYKPISETSSFTNYFGEFGDDEQIELSNLFKSNDKTLQMLSNSDLPFFDKLYKGYNIERISARRNINRDATKRGAINEILVKNF